MPGPISQNGNFYSNDASSPKISWFQISFKSVKPFAHKKRLRILQNPIPYCVSLIMVTITIHIFINIFQTVHFSAIKFTWVMRKIWAFFWYQNLRKFEKNLKQSDRAPLSMRKIWLHIKWWNTKFCRKPKLRRDPCFVILSSVFDKFQPTRNGFRMTLPSIYRPKSEIISSPQ